MAEPLSFLDPNVPTLGGESVGAGGLGGMLGQEPDPGPAMPSVTNPVLASTEPYQEESFFDGVQKKVWEGFLGTPIPSAFPSMGIGAATGAAAGAAVGGVGALPGALLGAAAGLLADYLGAAAGEATKRAIGPEGIEVGGLTISPELGQTIAHIGVGILGGGAAFKGALKLGSIGQRLGVLDTIKPGVKLGEEAQLTLQGLMPVDPRNLSRTHPQYRDMMEQLNSLGVKGVSEEFVDVSRADLDSFNKLMEPMYSASERPVASVLDKVFPWSQAKKGARNVEDVFTTRLLRWLAAPRHIMKGEPAGERAIDLKASASMVGRAVETHYDKEFSAILRSMSKQDQKDLMTAWHGTQGKSTRELEKGATKAAPVPEGQIRLFDDIPVTSPDQMFREHSLITEEFLKRTGKAHLIEPHRQASKLLEDMGNVLVKGGLLDPKDLKPNYLSFLRNRVKAERATLIESPNGYFPVYIEDALKARTPYMLHARRSDIPPTELSLQDHFKAYTSGFSKAISRNAIVDEYRQLMPQIQDPLKAQYLETMFNHFMGVPGTSAEHLSRKAMEVVKQVQFFRTIGASVLTATVNTAQRLNTLAYVDTKNWAKAAIPNTKMAARARELGLFSDQLNMADIQAMDAGYTGIRKGVRTILEKPFAWSEHGNITHAFTAGVYQALDRGLPMKLAEQYGMMVAERTQFVTRIGRTPTGAYSDVGGAAMQFKAFMMNQLGFVSQNMSNNPKGLAKFMIANLLMFGTDAVAPGADLAATRAIFGKPFKTKASTGIIGYAGAALAEQISIMGVDPDDMKRLAMFLPGPAFEHIQIIASALSGVHLGAGLDVEKFGQPMSKDERAAAFLRAIPGGAQWNRLRKGVKAMRAGGEERVAQDYYEAFGFESAKGPLNNKLDRTEAAMRFMGIQPTRLGEQQQYTDAMRQVEQEYTTTTMRVAELQVNGRNKEASDLVREFRKKYPEVAYFMPSQDAFKAALERKMLTGPQRALKAAPKAIQPGFQQALRSTYNRPTE